MRPKTTLTSEVPKLMTEKDLFMYTSVKGQVTMKTESLMAHDATYQ